MPSKITPEQVFVFTGPTLSPKIATGKLDAVYLPPARLGDIYRVCELYQPRVIGIIDGYFNQVPAVWHKELLQAMDRGIRIWGAASMGALRAAELDQMGMTGVGRIYQAYQGGFLPPYENETFEDDDEVAVIHGPAELDYLAASDAMVNIRFTLIKALKEKVIDEPCFQQLTQLAKHTFYAERSYARLLETATDNGVATEAVESLRQWLPLHAVEQKKTDALALLDAISVFLAQPETSPHQNIPELALTHQWQAAIIEIDASHRRHHPALDELRLQGKAYATTLDQALQHAECLCATGKALSPAGLTLLHRDPNALHDRLTNDWQAKFTAREEDDYSPTQIEYQLLNYLGSSGQMTALEDRAAHKHTLLSALKSRPDSATLNELQLLQLCDWYFETCLQVNLPNNLEAYVASLGLEDIDEFYAMLLDEYLYRDLI